MTSTTLTCPHCGHSEGADSRQLPADLQEYFCSACQKAFSPSHCPENDRPPADGAPLSSASSRTIPFVFTGSAKEYFGIWIVNTLLKIVTLGIYSPWAKVRKRQYFYGNTLLDGANFDYLANPLALLKGWLIGAALFICYSLGSQYSPTMGMLLGVLFFLLMPWVIVRSRLFNNRNSAHRNIRFNFNPAYGEAYAAYAWFPILTGLTGGLLAPYVYYRQKRFMVENNLYGTSPFLFEARGRDFYFIAFKVFGLLVLGVVGVALSMMQLESAFHPLKSMVPAFTGFFLVLGYLLILVFAYVRTTNLTWNSTRLGENRFVSTIRFRDMAWIMSSNLVATLLSFGMLIPWASVRLARYRLGNLALVAYGDLDLFQAGRPSEASATGEEIGDIFGVDIGI